VGYFLRRHLTPDQVQLVAVNAAMVFAQGLDHETDVDMEIDLNDWEVRVWGGGRTEKYSIDQLIEMV
jgi:hypothetical protein